MKPVRRVRPPSPAAIRQAEELLGFIERQLRECGRSPNLPEIAARFGFSKERARQVVRRLESQGRIDVVKRNGVLRITIRERAAA